MTTLSDGFETTNYANGLLWAALFLPKLSILKFLLIPIGGALSGEKKLSKQPKHEKK